ncbi:MAG: hypothetical protein JJE04_24325 [Acidobacteriia bacterium]|nr:hypothetical protein [Terriglobia bacterium]
MTRPSKVQRALAAPASWGGTPGFGSRRVAPFCACSLKALVLFSCLIPLSASNGGPARVDLGSRWIPSLDHHLSPYFVLSFQIPAYRSSHYLRLSIPGLPSNAKLWLDSAPLLLVQDSEDEWLIPNLAPPGSTARIAAATPSFPGSASLILSTRVHLAKLDAIACQDHFTATAWVRNTLDNTVNVSLTLLVQGHAVSASANATVPPGLMQSILLRIPIAAKPGQGLEVLAALEKAEEAMEPAYAVTSARTFLILDVAAPACH